MATNKNKKLEKVLERLEQGLDRQEEAYTRMLELSKKQKRILEREEFEKLGGLVREKNNIMDTLSEIEEEIKPILNRWNKLQTCFAEETVERIRDRVREVRSLLKEILELEEHLEESAEAIKEEAAGELGKLMQAQKANQSYGQSAS